MPITIPILIFSLCFFIGLLLFKILLAVIVGHQIAVHTCLKVDCKKTLDVCFLHSGYFKALIGYDFFDSVRFLQNIFGFEDLHLAMNKSCLAVEVSV